MTQIWRLPASQRLKRRWRNGGGITRDVAIFPAASADEDFHWRASLAIVDAPVPFSPWPAVDRILTLASGDMRLTIDGTVQHLGAESAPLSFSGDAAVHGQPLGSCCVFNLMLRHGKAHATVERWNAPHSDPMAVIADQLLIFAPSACTITIGREIFTLASEDALLINAPNAAQLFRPDGAVIAAKINLL